MKLDSKFKISIKLIILIILKLGYNSHGSNKKYISAKFRKIHARLSLYLSFFKNCFFPSTPCWLISSSV